MRSLSSITPASAFPQIAAGLERDVRSVVRVHTENQSHISMLISITSGVYQ